jgi:hypothetical protein
LAALAAMWRQTRGVGPADSFEHLLGSWATARTIDDARSGTTTYFVGTTTVSLRDDTGARRARLEEVGELRSGSWRGTASRRLDCVGRAGTVELCFLDGLPFVDLDLRTGRARAIHLCGDDRYEIEVACLDADRLEERWTVRGPAKEYEATTLLSRRR